MCISCLLFINVYVNVVYLMSRLNVPCIFEIGVSERNIGVTFCRPTTKCNNQITYFAGWYGVLHFVAARQNVTPFSMRMKDGSYGC